LLVFAGITGSSVFSTQHVVTLRPGDAAQVGQYRIRFDGLSQTTRHGALVVTARLRAFSGARDLGPLDASRNLFLTSSDSTTDVALRSTPANDLYVILAAWTREGEATLRLLVNPLVMWIWAGGIVLTAGAVIAMLPERRPANLLVREPARAWIPEGT
jgi:cytochrome c-type biogenesis protein CcmF